MRICLFISLFIFIEKAFGQINTLVANYQVTKDIDLSHSSQKDLNLSYKGYYFQKGNRSFSFIKPEYLALYPKGFIPLPSENFGIIEHSLCIDTIQQINYIHHDSLLFRGQANFTGGKKGENVYFTYDRDFYEWKLVNETKVIEGLQCQRAQRFNIGNGTVIWDGWFATDIPVNYGIENIINAPGLMVEGHSIGAKTHYKLISYEINVPVDDTIFWPAEFNQPFKFRRHLSKNALPN